MKAFILAGGIGSRLNSQQTGKPKILVEIAGKPILEYQLQFLRKNHISNIVLCLGYLADVVIEYVKGRCYGDLDFEFSVEEKPLGTGGAIKLAEKYFHQPGLIFNGDTFSFFDVSSLVLFHEKNQADFSMACHYTDKANDYGWVEMNEKNKITRYREKEPGVRSGWINSGFYFISPEILKAIPPQTPVSLEKDIFPILLRDFNCFAFQFKGFFLDAGTPERLQIAQQSVELQKLFS